MFIVPTCSQLILFPCWHSYERNPYGVLQDHWNDSVEHWTWTLRHHKHERETTYERMVENLKKDVEKWVNTCDACQHVAALIPQNLYQWIIQDPQVRTYQLLRTSIADITRRRLLGQYTFFACRFCFPNTDHVTIHRRFQILLFSLKRACSNITMSNFQIKHSHGYRHMICIGETKLTSKKSLLHQGRQQLRVHICKEWAA